VNLKWTIEQAQELEIMLESSLSELSHEIAATDDARYRLGLTARPSLLRHHVSPGTPRFVSDGTIADQTAVPGRCGAAIGGGYR